MMHCSRRLAGIAALAFALFAAILPATAAEPAPRQALLLEAADGGATGATPFTGTVHWSIGDGPAGLPALIGRVFIPARGLELSLSVQPNTEASLPATHLVELNFTLRDEFTGGGIASLPGLLLKAEQLVPGKPLVGASARVVANSFLFAMADFPEDRHSNLELLRTGAYLDIALIYGSGKRALLTLERDATALAEFAEIERRWGGAPAAPVDFGPAVILGDSLPAVDADTQQQSLAKRFDTELDGRAIALAPALGSGSEDLVYLVVATASLQEAVSLCADIAAAGGACTPAGDRAPIAVPQTHSPIDPKALPN